MDYIFVYGEPGGSTSSDGLRLTDENHLPRATTSASLTVSLNWLAALAEPGS